MRQPDAPQLLLGKLDRPTRTSKWLQTLHMRTRPKWARVSALLLALENTNPIDTRCLGEQLLVRLRGVRDVCFLGARCNNFAATVGPSLRCVRCGVLLRHLPPACAPRTVSLTHQPRSGVELRGGVPRRGVRGQRRVRHQLVRAQLPHYPGAGCRSLLRASARLVPALTADATAT